jgi:hypothetical protein
MLCSTLVTLNITFYQRTLLGTSANQKRHYLKSYNNIQLLHFIECDMMCYGALESNIDQGAP